MKETPAKQSISPALALDFIGWIDRSPKTARSYAANLRQFIAWLNYEEIRQPDRESIILYRDWLASEHDAIMYDSATGWKYRTDSAGDPIKISCSANTTAQYLRSVCAFFRWTAAAGLYPNIAENIHGPKIRHDTHRKDALTAEEVQAIELSIKDQTRRKSQAAQEAQKDTAGRLQRSTEQGKRALALFALAVNAGLRTVELARANIKDLETKGGQSWLYIWGKGHSEPDQKKPLAPEVAQIVKEYLQSRTDSPTRSSPLFVSTGNRSGGRRMAPTTISAILKRAMQAAGYDSERLTAHSLRHTAGTAIQEISKDIYATQKYMRHADPATTEIYLHNDTEKAEADLAQQLYYFYHGQTDSRQQLRQIIEGMTPEQIEQLTELAAEIQKEPKTKTTNRKEKGTWRK